MENKIKQSKSLRSESLPSSFEENNVRTIPQSSISYEVENKSSALMCQKNLKENIDNRLKDDTLLDSIELEKRLINSIIKNDVKIFNWIFQSLKQAYFAKLHSDKLTSLKYKYVGLITLVTRASINNGVSPFEGYGLSDSLIQGLESVRTISECSNYIRHSCLQFMKLNDNTLNIKSNPLVKDIIEYIMINLHNKITIEDIALHCNKHNSYITSKFKEVTGDTIHHYINRKKIDGAKDMLLFTNIESSEIAEMFSFSDQSHFIKIFKKLESMTPLEYRNKYQATKIL